MTQQSLPNPVDLYDAALGPTKDTLARVRPNQLKDPTPCAEWDVEALVDHILGGAGMLSGILSGGGPDQPPPDKDRAAAFEALAHNAVRLAREAGALEREYTTPMGDMAGGYLVMMMFMDQVIHRWDLAKATGQDTAIDPEHVEVIFNALKDQTPQMRQAGVIGPEVSVPESAPLQDRLLGMMGRTP
ncbi:MAG: TIGR03086 family metal-binding protein [Chloroflexota bacterium]